MEVPLKQDAQKKFVRQTSFWGRLGKWTNQVLGGPFHLDKGKVPSLDDQFTSLTGNEAGYTAQDAPSMRMPKITRDLRTYGPTDQRTDTTSYRDAMAHLKSLPNFEMRLRISI